MLWVVALAVAAAVVVAATVAVAVAVADGCAICCGSGTAKFGGYLCKFKYNH